MKSIKSEAQHWPIKGSFRISRSAVTEVGVVVVTISDGTHFGRGECRPYPRYNETIKSVLAQIATLQNDIETLSLSSLQDRLPNGAARNAVDCALWDLEAQITGKPVHELLRLTPPKTRQTAFTLSIDSPTKMAESALAATDHKLLKIKVGHEDGLACALAVMKARPDVHLIIDANEALDAASLEDFQTHLKNYPVALIEQPLPADISLPPSCVNAKPIICADESLHTVQDLQRLWDEGFRAVNIKLDKAGGLTEAITLARRAKSMGYNIMLGCMVSSSLAMAPALLLESFADVIDLDGALLLARDHDDGMIYSSGTVSPAPKTLWGYPRKI